MIDFFKKHYLVFVLAFLLSLFTFGPQLWAINSMGDDFSGIYPINTSDDIYYYARGKDIMDGHYFLSNPYLYEHKSDETMQVWLSDYVLAKPLYWLGIDLPVGYIAYDFILPFILILLSYNVLYLISKSRTLSLSGSTFLHAFLFFGLFGRSISPQFTFLFFLLLAFFLLKYLKENKKIFAVLTSICLGLLFYIYPYYWTFYVVLFFVFILLALFKIKKFNYKPYLYILLGAFVLAIPYFISLYNSSKLPYYNESIYRLGMIDTHFPSGIKIVVLGLLLLALYIFLYKKGKIIQEKISLLLLSGTVASILVTNQHIVTGKNLEFSSHYWQPSVFWFVFLLTYIISRFNLKKINFIILFLVIIIAVPNVSSQVLADSKPEDFEFDWQKYGQVIEWLDENTDKDSVVYANNNISQLIAIYSDNNVYYTRWANLHFISDREVYERFIINNYYEEIDQEFLLQNIRSVWGVHYIDEMGHWNSKNRLFSILGHDSTEPPLVPVEKIDEVLDLSEQIKAKDFKELTSKYRLDYILWDKQADPNWGFEELDFLKTIYDDGNFIVYQLQ